MLSVSSVAKQFPSFLNCLQVYGENSIEILAKEECLCQMKCNPKPTSVVTLNKGLDRSDDKICSFPLHDNVFKTGSLKLLFHGILGI